MGHSEYGARGCAGGVLVGGTDRADERFLQAELAVQVAGLRRTS
ncbi:hypothetical protein ACQHIV_41000 [Kribbella sp. GL6]